MSLYTVLARLSLGVDLRHGRRGMATRISGLSLTLQQVLWAYKEAVSMVMVTGKGVKLEKAERAIAKSAGELIDGEVVWYFAKCNNLKPMTDAIVITSARVMGLSTALGFKFTVLHSHIESTSYDEKRGTVEVTAAGGETMTFKSVDSEDVPVVAHYIEYSRKAPIPDVITHGLAARAREDRVTDEPARYGQKTAEGIFGMRTVRVYDKGFVRVSVPLFGSNARFEQLISIEASSDVSKKSGVGRGAAAVMTGGLNLAGSNKRGDVYLTISTDVTTHVLHEDPPTKMNLKTAKRLEAAGLAVLHRSPSVETDVPETVMETTASFGAPTVSERLRELSALREQGLVSQDEFDQLRAKLLDSI